MRHAADISVYIAAVQDGQLAKPGRCAACGKISALNWHGTYYRTLITTAKTWLIPVKRLFCRLCRHTFALLPDFVVKFHRYAKEVIHSAIRRLKSLAYDAVAEQIANAFLEPRKKDIATLTLYLWRRKFS